MPQTHTTQLTSVNNCLGTWHSSAILFGSRTVLQPQAYTFRIEKLGDVRYQNLHSSIESASTLRFLLRESRAASYRSDSFNLFMHITMGVIDFRVRVRTAYRAANRRYWMYQNKLTSYDQPYYKYFNHGRGPGEKRFECLTDSNRTIFSPLIQFCWEILRKFSPSYWEANINYPRGPIMGKGNSPNFNFGWDRGFSVPGSFILDHLHPL